MKVGYYPGCSLESTGKPYDLSTRRVCEALEVGISDLPDWLCCGSSPGLKVNRLLSLSLAAKNISQAEKHGIDEVLVPCPFCFRRLLSAQQEIREDGQAKVFAEQAIGSDLSGDLNILNPLGFFCDAVGMQTIEKKISNPLKGLKVVPFYGCYMVKPSQVTRFDDPENPTSMDRILNALGAGVMEWDFKTECCGASLSVSKTEKVVELSGRILREALWRGADAVVVACQLCQSNLDMRQGEILNLKGNERHLPVLYFTQLMGLAFGIPARGLGLGRHLVDALPLLKEKGLVQ
jgi:heterodisulfide reductase subunit B